MTEKEKGIFKYIKEAKVEYAKVYCILKWITSGIILTPILIWLSYLIGHKYRLISTDITAGDSLAFFGAILTFISTALLGALALWQNVKANSINDRLSMLEKARFKLDLQPFVLLTNWKVELEEYATILEAQKIYIQIDGSKLGNGYSCLTLYFSNTSNSYVLLSYSNAKVYHNDTFIENLGNTLLNQQNENLFLESGATNEISLFCSKKKMASFLGKKIRLELILNNRFSERYKETIDIVVPVLDQESCYVVLNPQNYQIQKYDPKKKKFILENEE
ncbi:hypothetical protein [Clostridium estertheticum]|uniref:hypothetical protein n=1 Tax=Clostridium estertheticum TaxID=238834 RepID=UPI001C0D3253|nr:hypothetical protein [Clostridium estertheticum]MBU3186539.1 hypothetical protein [Clostridium estertheticum]